MNSQKSVILKIDKFSTYDGRGIRTVVFLKGCPLRCQWCHSPESWSFQVEKYPDGEKIGTLMSTNEVLDEVLKDKDFYDASNGGLTISGGEVLASPDFAIELLKKAKAQQIHTAIETSGYANANVLERFLPYVDMWLWDVKHLDAKKHLFYTGKSVEPILKNLKCVNDFILSECNLQRTIILRCPMIMNVNDDILQLKAIGELAETLQAVSEIDVEPYIPFGLDKAKRLNLPIKEFEIPVRDYGTKIVAELSKFTSKLVKLTE